MSSKAGGSFSDRLREERNRLGVTQEYFAALGGVGRSAQIKYERGERRPDICYLAAIAHAVDIQYIITSERQSSTQSNGSAISGNIKSLVFMPRYEVRASAGVGVYVFDEEVTQTFAFRRDWLKTKGLSEKNLSIITVQGNSMSPRLNDGDFVLVDQGDTTVKSGNAYVVRVNDELLVKLAQRLPENKLQLSSANPDYPPFIVDASGSVDIIGRVVCSSHEW